MAFLLNKMKENQKKSFDFAADITKQLITLSTAIITLTVTFSKDIVGVGDTLPKILLVWTWGIFILSIFFGILTLMALTGTLQPLSKEKKEIKDENSNDASEKAQEIVVDDFSDITINKGNTRRFSTIQILLFVGALIMTAIYGYKSLPAENKSDLHKNTYPIIRESRLSNDTTKYIDTLYLPK